MVATLQVLTLLARAAPVARLDAERTAVAETFDIMILVCP